MASKEKYTVTQVVDALKAAKGRVYLAAEHLGCSYRTVYYYIDRHAKVKDAARHQKGRRGDVAESKLDAAVEAGEAWAICFLLKTQYKDRGYVEKSIVQQEQGKTLRIVRVVVDGGSDNQGADAPSPESIR